MGPAAVRRGLLVRAGEWLVRAVEHALLRQRDRRCGHAVYVEFGRWTPRVEDRLRQLLLTLEPDDLDAPAAGWAVMREGVSAPCYEQHTTFEGAIGDLGAWVAAHVRCVRDLQGRDATFGWTECFRAWADRVSLSVSAQVQYGAGAWGPQVTLDGVWLCTRTTPVDDIALDLAEGGWPRREWDTLAYAIRATSLDGLRRSAVYSEWLVTGPKAEHEAAGCQSIPFTPEQVVAARSGSVELPDGRVLVTGTPWWYERIDDDE